MTGGIVLKLIAGCGMKNGQLEITSYRHYMLNCDSDQWDWDIHSDWRGMTGKIAKSSDGIYGTEKAYVALYMHTFRLHLRPVL